MSATVISGLDISHGTALVPAPFKRWVRENGQPCNLNSASTTAVFLWVRTSGVFGDGINAVVILYDDEATPPGFRRIARDLSVGDPTGTKSFIAYSTLADSPSDEPGGADTNARVVASVAVLNVNDAVPDGWDVLPRSLNRSSTGVRLALRWVTASQCGISVSSLTTPAAWAQSLKVGDLLDCSDRCQLWRVGKVVRISDDGEIEISFKGWSAKHNEMLPRSSKRLARLGAYSAVVSSTLAYKRQGEALSISVEVLESLETRIADVISGEFPPGEEREHFLRAELPSYVREILASKYDNETLRNRVNKFNQAVLTLTVWSIRRLDEPLPPDVRQHLLRLFLDGDVNYYFQAYGGVQSGPLAESAAGFAARIPPGGASRYYVENVNVFYNLGGHDAILSRLQHQIMLCESSSDASNSTTASVGTSGGKQLQLVPGIDTSAGDDPLAEVNVLASVLFVPRVCYTEQWAGQYYARLRDAVLTRVLVLPDTLLKRTPRETIEAIADKMTSLGRSLLTSYPNPESRDAIVNGPPHRINSTIACVAGVLTSTVLSDATYTTRVTDFRAPIECWTAALAVRLIRTDSLALRVKGVADIRELIEAVAGPHGSGGIMLDESWYGGEKGASMAGTLSTGVSTSAANTASSTSQIFRSNSRSYSMLPGATAAATWWTSNPASEHTASWFDAPRLAAFLDRNSVLATLLGGSGRNEAHTLRVHVQTLSRLGSMLVFLATHSAATPMTVPVGNSHFAATTTTVTALRDEHISRLLDIIVEENDDAIRRSVFELLRGLSRFLPTSLRAHLFMRLGSTPLETFDALMVTTLRDLTEHAFVSEGFCTSESSSNTIGVRAGINSSTAECDTSDVSHQNTGPGRGWNVLSRAPDGLINLWEAALSVKIDRGILRAHKEGSMATGAALYNRAMPHNNLPTLDVGTLARDAVVMLCRPRPMLAQSLAMEAARLIVSGFDAPPCISLLSALLVSLATSSRAIHKETLRMLHSDFGFPHRLVDELQGYKNKAMNYASSMPEGSSADLMVVERHLHAEHINLRLSFLSTFVREAALLLSYDDVKAIWGATIDTALCAAERERGIDFVCSLRFGESSTSISDDVGAAIFRLLFCNHHHFPAAMVTVRSLRVFEYYMRLTAWRDGVMDAWSSESYCALQDSADTSRGPQLNAAMDLQVTGIDSLWALALHSGQADVEDAAGKLLIRLYAYVDVRDKPVTARAQVPDLSEEVYKSIVAVKEGVWRAFVGRAVNTIHPGDDGMHAAQSTPRVIGCGLRILRSFLDTMDKLSGQLPESLPCNAVAPQPIQDGASGVLHLPVEGRIVPECPIAHILVWVFVPEVLAKSYPRIAAFTDAPITAKMDSETCDSLSEDSILDGGASLPPVERASLDASRDAPRVLRLEMGVRPSVETFAFVRDRIADALGVDTAHITLCMSPRQTRFGGAVNGGGGGGGGSCGVTNIAALAAGPPPPLPAAHSALVVSSSVAFEGRMLSTARTCREYIASVTPSSPSSPPADCATDGDHSYVCYADRVRAQAIASLRASVPTWTLAEAEAEFSFEEFRTNTLRTALLAPRSMLSSSRTLFHTLFGLLSSALPSIVVDAWALIQMLPTHPTVEHAITSPHRTPSPRNDHPSVATSPVVTGRAYSPDSAHAASSNGGAFTWSSLFDATSPLKLLYALKILIRHASAIGAASGLLTTTASANVLPLPPLPVPAAGDRGADEVAAVLRRRVSAWTLDTAHPWCSDFAAAGGVAHLIATASDATLTHELLRPDAPPLYCEAALLLIAVVSGFTLGCDGRIHTTSRSLFDGLRTSKLITALLLAVAHATTSDVYRLRAGNPDAASLTADREHTPGTNQVDDESSSAIARVRVAIIEHVLELLTALLRAIANAVPDGTSSSVAEAARRTSVSAVRSFPLVDDVVAAALLAPNDLRVRLAVSVGLQRACAATDEGEAFATAGDSRLTTWVTQQLLQGIRRIYVFPNTCLQYIHTTTRLLQQCSTALAVNDVDASFRAIDVQSAATLLVTVLAAHPVVEVSSEESEAPDTILLGLLQLLAELLLLHPKLCAYMLSSTVSLGASTASFLDVVVDGCLFDRAPLHGGAQSTSSDSASLPPPKCKHPMSRRAAYRLMSVFVAGDAVRCGAAVLAKLLPYHDPALVVRAGGNNGIESSTAHSGVNPFSTAPTVSVEASSAGASAPASPIALWGSSSNGGKYGAVTGPLQALPSVASRPSGAPGPGSMSPLTTSRVRRNASNVHSAPRSAMGYVGLRNLGCICYMNATLQQFFMVSRFRAGVLAWSEPIDGDHADSLLLQLQRQFAYLQESERQSYNPRALCAAIKDWDGAPTDVGEQKDVPEFLTKLFADMEMQAQGTPTASLVKDVFGGVQLQELIAVDPRLQSSDPGHSVVSGENPTLHAVPPVGSRTSSCDGSSTRRLYAARQEEFTFLQVIIKNHARLEDALAAHIAGETVDYKWDLPDAEVVSDVVGGGGVGAARTPVSPVQTATVRSTKRVSLLSLGHILMVHLNRFAFDFDAMMQVKLNDRFEFPRTLDVWPYTVFGRPDAVYPTTATPGAPGESSTSAQSPPDRADFIYELVGVVIHLGTAIGGHYYSFVRERHPVAGPAPGDRWFEFNDNLVTPWEATDAAFDRDCFGGVESIAGRNAVSRYSHERVKTANAFCLLYERRAHGAQASLVPLSSGKAASDGVTQPTFTAASELRPPLHVAVSSLSGVSALPGGTTLPIVEFPADAVRAYRAHLYTGGAGRGEVIRAAARSCIPADIMAEIWADNAEFWRARSVYCDEYFQFVLDTVKRAADKVSTLPRPEPSATRLSLPHPAQDDISSLVRFAVSFMIHTLPESTASQRGSDRATHEWAEATCALLIATPVTAKWVVLCALEAPSEFRQHLLSDTGTCGDVSRTLFAELCAAAAETAWRGDGGVDSCASVGALVRLLLSFLPRLHVHWRRIDGYFLLLRRLVDIDARACALFVNEQAIARIVDFAICGRGPHNMCVAADVRTTNSFIANASMPPLASTSTRSMGDALAEPDFSDLFRTLTLLVTSCAPPSGSAGSPQAQPPQATLATVDVEQLCCEPFFALLALQLSSAEATRRHAPLVTHLIWGAQPAQIKESRGMNCGVVDAAATAIANGIVAAEHDELKPYFRLTELVLSVAGDDAEGALAALRTDFILFSLLSALLSQSCYYRATESGLELLVRLAKRCPCVASWLSSARGRAAADWAPRWLKEYDRPPLPGATIVMSSHITSSLVSQAASRSSSALAVQGADSDGGIGATGMLPTASARGDIGDTPPVTMRLMKRPQVGYGGGGGHYFSSPPERPQHLLPNMAHLLAPSPACPASTPSSTLFFDTLESDDDPAEAVGRRVAVWRAGARARVLAIVESYDADAPGHILRFNTREVGGSITTEREIFNLRDTRRARISFVPPEECDALEGVGTPHTGTAHETTVVESPQLPAPDEPAQCGTNRNARVAENQDSYRTTAGSTSGVTTSSDASVVATGRRLSDRLD